ETEVHDVVVGEAHDPDAGTRQRGGCRRQPSIPVPLAARVRLLRRVLERGERPLVVRHDEIGALQERPDPIEGIPIPEPVNGGLPLGAEQRVSQEGDPDRHSEARSLAVLVRAVRAAPKLRIRLGDGRAGGRSTSTRESPSIANRRVAPTSALSWWEMT